MATVNVSDLQNLKHHSVDSLRNTDLEISAGYTERVNIYETCMSFQSLRGKPLVGEGANLQGEDSGTL